MKAMILAAGRGERMRPLTDHTPKPLLVAGGKPLIVWAIERLRAARITDLVINHAHLGPQLEAALGDGSSLGVRIRWSAEGTALETAGGMAYARHLFGEAPFIAVNADVWCDYAFDGLPARAASVDGEQCLAHLVLVPNPDHHPEGDFSLEDGLASQGPAPRHTFSGIGLYHPRLLDPVTPGQAAKLGDLLRAAMPRGLVSGELYQGRWTDVGTPRRLAELDAELREVPTAPPPGA